MTWQPRYKVRKADGVGGAPIPDDEPCLVVRAQDELAIPVAAGYLQWLEADPEHDPVVAEELHAHLDELIRWQNDNKDRIKKADR